MGGGGGKGGSQTIGYKYYLGLHMLLCHGPVDKVGPIYAGERTAYGSSVYYDGTVGDPRPIFTPPSGWDLRMTLTNDDIEGTLSPWTDAQNITNVTFSSGGATFANGYMDIGDFSPGALGTGGWGDQSGKFSVAFVFTPADAGDDLQVLFGKHTDDSPTYDGGRDILVLWYQRSKGRVGYTYGRAEVAAETETDIHWLSDEDVFSPGEEHETLFLWKQTRWDHGEGEISYSSSVSLYRNNSYIGGSSYVEHCGWSGRSWVIGADWDYDVASRDNEYNGTMKDFYIWDDRLLTTSELWPVSSTPGASEQRIYIGAPELFGGEKKEGGIQGKVDICFGADNQEQNDYLLGRPGMTATTLPAYRGVVSVIARQCYVCAMSPYPKPWWFRIENIPGKDWYPSKASINPGSTGTSANAAHMLRQCILDDEWGMGYPHTSVDDSSFEACADTLYDEGFGLSMLLNNQGSIEEFMQEILKHVNGVLYTDRETGLFTMKLIRDDYSIPSLPVFDDSNIVALDSFQRPTFAEMVNEVTIIYRKRGDFQDSSVTFQDLASAQAQGGVVAQTMNFPGVDDGTIASKVGMRELKQQSTPLAQVQLTVNRDGWSVNPGDPIVFEWPEYGITQMVLRVLKANYGEVLQGKIKFDCVEDAFSLPATTYLEPQDPMWEDPVSDPTAVPDSWLQEATYYELATGIPLGSTWVEDLDPAAAFLIYMAKPPAVASSSFELWTYLSLPYTFKATGSYTIIGELSLSVGYTDTVFKLANLRGGADSIEVNSYAFIGNEIVRIDDVDLDTEEVTVGRGCIDTIPEQHLAGTEMWFGKTSWGLDFTEYAQGNTVHAKALPMTGYGTLDISLATDETLTMVGRQYKPYPVARVAFQSSTNYYPLFVYGANATLVYFANRNRLQQTVIDQIEDWFDSNITPEANVTYTFRWFGELDVGKATTGGSRVDTGVTGTSHSWARADELADSNVGAFSPIDGHDLNMPLNSDDIGGTLSPWTDAQNVTNVTFTDRATFAAGYIDIGDFALTTAAFTISMIFVPQNTGDDYQLLIGKHTDDGTGGTNIFSVFWRRSTKQLYVGYGSTVASVGTAGDVRIGRKNELMVVRNGSYTRLSLNGKYLGQRSHSISSWTGRPWVLGADWQPSDPTRQFRYNGTMHDLRIWDNTILVESDLWPNDRVNRYFRLVIETIRDGTNSLQNYDFTVDDRGGWGLSWDNNFNT